MKVWTRPASYVEDLWVGGRYLIPNSVGFLTKSNSLLFVSYSLRSSFCCRLLAEGSSLLIGPALRSFPSYLLHLKSWQWNILSCQNFLTLPISLISPSVTSQRKLLAFKEPMWLDYINLNIWYLLFLHFKIIFCISQTFYNQHIYLLIKKNTNSCFGTEFGLTLYNF